MVVLVQDEQMPEVIARDSFGYKPSGVRLIHLAKESKNERCFPVWEGRIY